MAVATALTAEKDLQLKLIIAFGMLGCGRSMQMEIIEQVIGQRKNITELDTSEARRILTELMGGE